jgi:hypothetical protein
MEGAQLRLRAVAALSRYFQAPFSSAGFPIIVIMANSQYPAVLHSNCMRIIHQGPANPANPANRLLQRVPSFLRFPIAELMYRDVGDGPFSPKPRGWKIILANAFWFGELVCVPVALVVARVAEN